MANSKYQLQQEAEVSGLGIILYIDAPFVLSHVIGLRFCKFINR